MGRHAHSSEGDAGHSHDHDPGHSHDHRTKPARALTIALGLTSSFMLVEVAGGIYSGSLALLADAGHMLSDAAALGLALIAQQWAKRARTERSTFGFRRAEVLAAFVNGIALALTAIWVVKEAVERWLVPKPILAPVMLVIAAGGLAVNLVVAAILSRSQESLNVRAALAHVATDALGSLAAIVAGACVLWFDFQRADPVLSVFIAILVAVSGWRVLRETTQILLESVPSHLDVVAIEAAIRQTPGVAGLHDLHVWCISDRFDALTVHVTLERGAHGVDVCRAIGERLKSEFALEHVTIQPEAPLPEQIVSVRSSRDGGPIRRVS